MAAVLDLAALTQGHEPVAGPPSPVAGGAEAGDVVHLHQPANDFIQCPVIDHVKLSGVFFFWLWIHISAHAGAGAAADLGDAKVEHPLPDFLALSCGNDHAGVRYGDADAGYQLGEGIVIDAIGKGTGVDVVRVPKPGDADGVGAYAERGFQVLRVHQKAGKFISVFVKTKEHADAYVVNTAFHCPVHCLCMIIIVMLWPGRMEFQIAFFVIGLLE